MTKFEFHSAITRAPVRAALALAMLFVLAHGASAADSDAIHPLDLSAKVTKVWAKTEPGTAWAAAPRGRQTIDAVPFHLDGVLEVTGMGAFRNELFPGRISDIVVNRRAEWIHVLHGTGYDAPDGTPIAKLVLRYDGGDTRDLVIRYGTHVRNWWKELSEKRAEVDDPNSTVAWTGTSRQTDGSGATLRLFRTSFPNPAPDKLIKSIDVQSLFARATPAIVGISAGAAGPAKANAPQPELPATAEGATVLGETKVRVRSNGSNRPLAGARVRVTIEDDRGAFPFGEHRTDTKGEVIVEYPAEHITRLGFQVSAAGHSAKTHRTEMDDFPKELEIKLDRGTPLGGIVQDDKGKPIAGAKVQISGVRRDDVGQFVAVEYDAVDTDAAGKWSSAAVPADGGTLSFKVTHSEFMPAEIDEAVGGTTPGPVVSKNALLAGNAVMTMLPGIAVEGIVTNEAGQPVESAEVTLGADGGTSPKRIAKTDTAGRFKIVVMEPGEMPVTVVASSLAPAQQSVQIEPGLKPLTFKLTKGKRISGRVVDSAGDKPVQGATVSVESWNDSKTLPWSTSTDADGRFTWDGAPDGVLSFAVTKPGFNRGTLRVTAPADQTVQLDRTFFLTGKVIDAETKEPIKKFTIVRGWQWGGMDNPNWQLNEKTTGENGTLTLASTGTEHGDNVQVMITADGYRPGVSPSLPKSGWHTNDFALKPGKPYAGVVRTTDGKPASGAQMALVGAGYLNLAKGELKSHDRANVITETTDAEGRFTLPAALPSPTIIAVHKEGYAEFPGDQLDTKAEVVLAPWGRIEGVAKNGSRLATNEMIMVSPIRTGGGGVNYDFELFKTTTDSEGRFAFDHVPPGERQLVRLIPMENGWMWSHLQPLTVKAGEVTKAVHGGIGRPVTAKLALSDPNRKVDWNIGHRGFSTRFPSPPQPLKTPAEWQQWNNSPEMQEARKKHRYYAFNIGDDGTLRIENVLPGTYDLRVNLNEPGPERYRPGPSIGSVSREVVVPPADGEFSDEAVDLGTLTIQVRNDSRPASAAKAP